MASPKGVSLGFLFLILSLSHNLGSTSARKLSPEDIKLTQNKELETRLDEDPLPTAGATILPNKDESSDGEPASIADNQLACGHPLCVAPITHPSCQIHCPSYPQPQPSYPQPLPQPSYPQPVYPQPLPQPPYPQPVYPEPLPQPVYPQPAYPPEPNPGCQPACSPQPEPNYPQPIYPQPIYPQPQPQPQPAYPPWPQYPPQPEPAYSPCPQPTYTPQPEPAYSPCPQPTYTPQPAPAYSPCPQPTYPPLHSEPLNPGQFTPTSPCPQPTYLPIPDPAYPPPITGPRPTSQTSGNPTNEPNSLQQENVGGLSSCTHLGCEESPIGLMAQSPLTVEDQLTIDDPQIETRGTIDDGSLDKQLESDIPRVTGSYDDSELYLMVHEPDPDD